MSARPEAVSNGAGTRKAGVICKEEAMKAYATNQNRHAIILAGGDGTRLSEVTRRITGDAAPKQFCPVIGDTSLLEQTRLRVSLVAGESRILTVLNRAHERYYHDLVNDVLPENLVTQPANRGTARLQSCMRFCDCPESPAMHTWRCFRRIIS